MTLAAEQQRSAAGRDFTRRRESVLDAATEIINEQGLDLLNLERVADVLDLKYQALYYYFESKEDLACEAFLRAFKHRRESLEEASSGPGSGLEKLRLFLQRELTTSRTERVSLSAMGALAEESLGKLHDARDETMNLLTELLIAGIDDGSVAPCHPQTRALALEGLLDRFVRLGQPVTREPIAHDVLEIITHGALMPGQRMPDPPRDNLPIETTLGYDRDLQDEEYARLQRVLRTATAAFNLKGAAATSIPEVARTMGVSKSVFYGYAKDKEELLYLCYARGAMMIDIAQRMAVVKAEDPPQRIALGYSYLFRAHGSEVGPIPVFNSLMFLSPPHRRVIGIQYRALSYNARGVLTEGELSGHFRSGAEAAHAVFSSQLTALPRWYTEDYPLSLDAVAAEIQRFVLLGLAPR